VLQVNDTRLTDVDLKLAQQLALAQLKGASGGVEPDQAAVAKRAVDQMIARTLLQQAAREAKVVVSPAEVNAAFEQQRGAQGIGFEKYLADLGLSERELKRRIEDQLLVRKFVDGQIASSATVTEAQALAFYDANPKKFEHPEEVRLRTILLQVVPNADEMQVNAVKTRAEEARKRVVVGEDMGVVAQAVSEDPSRARGGEIGWVRKGMLLPEVEDTVWALKAGELSPVLRSKVGYHLFLVEDHRAAGRVAFEEVKGRLLEALNSNKLATAVETLVQERQAKASIVALDPVVKAVLEGRPPSLVAAPPIPGRAASETTATSPKTP
jgi:parvulin-like peptidyl-prolyl isomerase